MAHFSEFREIKIKVGAGSYLEKPFQKDLPEGGSVVVVLSVSTSLPDVAAANRLLRAQASALREIADKIDAIEGMKGEPN